MTVPYTRTLLFSTESGVEACVELPAPPRGVLERIVIKQTEGELGGFSYNLYDRAQACGESSLSVSQAVPGDTESGVAKSAEPELHQIVATAAVVAGEDVSARFGLAAPYVNQDDQDVRKTPFPKLYLRLDPSGGGHKAWQVSYTVTCDMG